MTPCLPRGCEYPTQPFLHSTKKRRQGALEAPCLRRKGCARTLSTYILYSSDGLLFLSLENLLGLMPGGMSSHSTSSSSSRSHDA